MWMNLAKHRKNICPMASSRLPSNTGPWQDDANAVQPQIQDQQQLAQNREEPSSASVSTPKHTRLLCNRLVLDASSPTAASLSRRAVLTDDRDSSDAGNISNFSNITSDMSDEHECEHEHEHEHEHEQAPSSARPLVDKDLPIIVQVGPFTHSGNSERAAFVVNLESRVDASGSAPATPRMSASFDPPHKPADTASFSSSVSKRFARARLGRRGSWYSRRSFVSNLSVLNRANLGRFGCSKLVFLVANLAYFLLAVCLLAFVLLTFIDYFPRSALYRLWRADILNIVLAIACCQLALSVIGFIGALSHRKPVLTLLMVCLWPLMVGYLYVGYESYRDLHSTQWDKSVNAIWTRNRDSRSLVQTQFHCCGFYSSFDRPFDDYQCQGFVNSTGRSSTRLSSALYTGTSIRLSKRQDLAVPEPIPDAPLDPAAPQTNDGTESVGADPASPTTSQPADAPAVSPGDQTVSSQGSQVTDKGAGFIGCAEPLSNMLGQYLHGLYILSFSLVIYTIMLFSILLLGAHHIYMD
ncbi:hypothetical protein BC831DRAFT_481988 [Entophlyctis helioformis]|nr:hypothetical protein BC831DRAFT_481988 [Entophlyctis helioformis]